MQQVKIVSKPGMNGTRIFGEDGRELRATSLVFRAGANEVAYAEISLPFVELDAVDIPARMIGPNGKEVRRIEYTDGTADEYGDA